ncbi:MAG TPA: hypothetical protein VMK53_09040 [Gemmatimonadales bacterium]|nr:hypothetical protein [Gemmatimonadales bacterium]
MPGPTTAAPSSGTPSIFSPLVDLLCVGGLSLVILVPLLASGMTELWFITLGAIFWPITLLNYAHFMASYRIVYRSREMILKHKWASMGVPLILLAVLTIGVAEATMHGESLALVLMTVVGSGYLAWHYTGQVWGMMASHAHLAGATFNATERMLVRTGLRILLAWHVVWFLRVTLADPGPIEPLYQALSWAGLLALALGGTGLGMLGRRTGHMPPARVLVPWLAIFAWYAAMGRWGIPALFLVQAFHALQYIQFPVRVELNRATTRSARRVALHMLAYGGGLILVSLGIVMLIPGPAMGMMENMFQVSPEAIVVLLLIQFINIHHYFTDGVIWKISNPEVRRELFAHVPRAAATPTVPGKDR